MTFPDGRVIDDDGTHAEPVITSMYGRRVLGHLVDGPWAEALAAAHRPPRAPRPDDPAGRDAREATPRR